MRKRLVLMFMAAASVSATLAAQAPAPASKAPAAKTPARPYVPAKTAWGDPDIQGNYTNKYEQGTPFEKPADLADKTLADVTNAELADIIKKRQQRAIENAPFL